MESKKIIAEFDSVDLAELASGRVKHYSGVLGIKVLQNRFSADNINQNDLTFAFPYLSAATFSPYSASALPGSYFIRSQNISNFSDSEPAKRRDVQLLITTSSETVANQVSNVLRSLGGRKIHFV